MKSEEILNVIRGLVRPFLAVFFPVTWVFMLFNVLSQGGTIEDIPDVYTWIVLVIVAEYIGERAIGKAFKSYKRK